MNVAITSEEIQKIRTWHDDRQARINAASSAIHHLNAALSAGKSLHPTVIDSITHARKNAIGNMRSILDERCPYV